ncbi:MAG: hypothetical protein WCE79_06235 [Xanthobacteraceae bacterium]
MLSKLGLLDVETIRSVIDAHIVVRQYGGHLVMRGGTRGSKERDQDRLILMPKEKNELVISLNEGTAAGIEKAIKKLAQYT